MKPIAVLLVATSLCTGAVAQAQRSGKPVTLAGAAVPAWPSMEKQVRSKWAATYPKEQLLAIEKIGDADYNEETGKTETYTSTASSGVENWEDFAWHDTSWSTTI